VYLNGGQLLVLSLSKVAVGVGHLAAA